MCANEAVHDNACATKRMPHCVSPSHLFGCLIRQVFVFRLQTAMEKQVTSLIAVPLHTKCMMHSMQTQRMRMIPATHIRVVLYTYSRLVPMSRQQAWDGFVNLHASADMISSEELTSKWRF